MNNKAKCRRLPCAFFTLFACLYFALPIFAQAPIVEKVEPPNWWAGHSVSTVRMLVRGQNFHGATVASKDAALKTLKVRVNSRGDHVFFDVSINKNAKPGKYQFDLLTAKGTIPVAFEISAPLDSKLNYRGITNEDIIYLIMTDRFADGDTENNKDTDRKNPRAWHGGDFRGITKHIPYLKELGITAIWLTPWYDNPDEENNCDKPWCPNTNYHGYHAIDYYGVENHFGTFTDLREMISECHRNGIKVIQDQVANHVGIQHPWAKRPPLDNWFSPFSQNTFDDSVLLSPNSTQAARDNLIKGWFNELLPDMNQYEPEVSRYLIQNALWWIGMTGIDGIRQDTIQYMPREFIRDWSQAILKQYPHYYMVGEVFEEDSAHTAFFQGGKTGWDGIDTQLPSVFDFNLWKTSQDVFTGKKPVRSLRDVLKYDGLYFDVNRVTTWTNNHDTDRFMSVDGAAKEGAMLYVAFTLTVRGIPLLYYGEEILMTGGHDPDNRKDFPGGFPGDTRSAFTKEGRTADEQKMLDEVRRWIEVRKRYKAIQEGKTIDISYDENSYVFARILGASRVVVGVNRGNDALVKFDTRILGFSEKEIDCRPDGGRAVTTISGVDGTINFPLPAQTVIVLDCSPAKS